jgi:phosphoadenosine phosphosulfate reductase
MPDDQRISSLNDIVESYAGLEGRQLIAAVIKNHPDRVALLSSFGAESSVLLHMVSELAPHLPVLFLDTEKLFPETHHYRDQLVRELGLTNLQVIHPDLQDVERVDPDGILNTFDKDLCCHFRKTIPMQKAFGRYDIIISGRKRFHGASRSDLQFISVQDAKVKIEPLAGFSALDLSNYMITHHLPSHPLKLQGYRSIGCIPCTSIGGTDDDPRAGRWAGTGKTECGIHFSLNGEVIRSEIRQAAGI